MMDCNKAEQLLVEYMYQELKPAKTLELEKHLETCDACSKTLENWRAIHRGYQRSDDIPQPPTYMKQRLMAAAREEISRKPSFLERFFLVLKPAFVLPVLILGLLSLLVLPLKSTKTEMAKAKAPEAAPAKQAPPVATMQRKGDTGGRADSRDEYAKKSAYGGESRREATPAETPSSAAGNEFGETRERDADSEKLMKDAIISEAPVLQEPEAKQEEAMDVPADDLAAKRQQEMEQQYQASPPAAAAPMPEAPSIVSKTNESGAGTQKNFEVAQSRIRSGDLAGGKRAAEVAVQQDKSGELAAQFHSAGRAYQSQGEPQQAILQYNLVLNNYPSYENSADVLLRLGESYEQIGEYGKALNAYRQLQRNAKMRRLADERIGALTKKQEVQEQLRSLGYVGEEKN